jgi:hypothetical protein
VDKVVDNFVDDRLALLGRSRVSSRSRRRETSGGSREGPDPVSVDVVTDPFDAVEPRTCSSVSHSYLIVSTWAP